MIKTFFANHLLLFFAVFTSSISAFIMKWRLNNLTLSLQDKFLDNLKIYFFLLFDPYVMICIFLTLTSTLLWMMAITKLDISYALPFTFFSVIIVSILAFFILGENISFFRLFGFLIMFVSLIIISRS